VDALPVQASTVANKWRTHGYRTDASVGYGLSIAKSLKTRVLW
jgi:hypothetical protein